MTEQSRQGEALLPDFCGSRALFPLLLIIQLASILLLAGRVHDSQIWERLLALSLYLHWIGLCSAAVLCIVRRWLGRLSSRAALTLSFLLLMLVTATISEIAWHIAVWQNLGRLLPDRDHGVFLTRSLLVCAIVSVLVLRYFWVIAQLRSQIRAEGESRYQALQARIRPHFLFNSLNSIAALIGSRPQQAETAVEDLAQLFRAGLSGSDRRVPFRDELEVTRAYLRTESLRLGPRLSVRWEVEPGLDELQVPSLCLQPLVENAVTHGIEPLTEGGEVVVGVRRSGARLELAVDNPVPPVPAASQGVGLALDNIRQRLKLMYGENADLHTGRSTERFTARLTLPVGDNA